MVINLRAIYINATWDKLNSPPTSYTVILALIVTLIQRIVTKNDDYKKDGEKKSMSCFLQ